MQIEGNTALVTGANRGIGRAFVDALIDANALKVYAGVRDQSYADEMSNAYGSVVEPLLLDITDPDQVSAAAAQSADLDILINNAGLTRLQRLIGAKSMQAAREEMEVNYFGTLAMCRAFAPILGANGGGAIVNVLSAAALINVPMLGTYAASKAATFSMSQGVRAELRKQGTLVSILIVGSVDTRMAAHVDGEKAAPAEVAAAGIRAILKDVEEVDTDRMAIDYRAALARDAKRLELQLSKMLDYEVMSTRKGGRAQ